MITDYCLIKLTDIIRADTSVDGVSPFWGLGIVVERKKSSSK